MAASFASREMTGKNLTYLFVDELRLGTKMAAFNYCKFFKNLLLLLVRLLALEKEVCWSDGVFIVMVRECAYAYLPEGRKQSERWMWSRGSTI